MIPAHNLRQIKVRIKSIGNTRKITRAMEMVSASKLSKVKTSFFFTKPYLASLENMLYDLLSDSPGLKNILLEKKAHIKSSALCVVTSDTGLCGAYNDNVIKYAERFLKDLDSPTVSIVAVGREGYDYFQKNGFRMAHSYLGLYGRYSSKLSDEIAKDLINMFVKGETDEVYVVYSHFKASLRHAPMAEKLLNIESPERPRSYYTFEPSAKSILNSMIPKYVTYKMREILLEAFTSEHSARMLAMKTATDNADDLTEQLTLARNKARQFAITKEVLEIAASAEALKG
ncbi:MAG: ATP synthase F1 subunit gamma [Candidatus Omnitrophica bacterium]|nr:ATP synthase F1 subunit gamma [Candidatus Omnitrophota bacterium]